MLTALLQFSSCCLLRFIIISSVHGTLSLSVKVHADIGAYKILLRESEENVDTGIVNMRICFSTG